MKKVIIRKANTARNGYCLVANKLTGGEIASLITDKTASGAASMLKAGKPLDGCAALASGAELAMILHATWIYDKTQTDNAIAICADTDRAKETLRHAQAALKIATDAATVAFSISGRDESECEGFIIDATRAESEAVYDARSVLAAVNERRKALNGEFYAAYLAALRKRREHRDIWENDNGENDK